MPVPGMSPAVMGVSWPLRSFALFGMPLVENLTGRVAVVPVGMGCASFTAMMPWKYAPNWAWGIKVKVTASADTSTDWLSMFGIPKRFEL